MTHPLSNTVIKQGYDENELYIYKPMKSKHGGTWSFSGDYLAFYQGIPVYISTCATLPNLPRQLHLVVLALRIVTEECKA